VRYENIKQTEKLQTKATKTGHKINNSSKNKDWNIFEDSYWYYKNSMKGQDYFKKQIAFLKDINDDMKRDTFDISEVPTVRNKIRTKIIDINNHVNSSLKNHIERVFRENIKDERALETIIKIVNMVIPIPAAESGLIVKKNQPSSITRVIGISILFCVILTILFGFFGSDYDDVNKRIIYLSFALFTFNYVISYLYESQNTITGFFQSCLCGGFAGAAGHLAFIAITSYHQFIPLTKIIEYDWTVLVGGLRIGMACAAGIHIYRYHLSHYTEKLSVKYALASAVGGFFVMLQDIFLVMNGNSHYQSFFLGVLVTMSSIFVTGVFEKFEDKAGA
jgi:hypothetical protein